VSEVVADLATTRGATIELGQSVASIEGNRVRMQNGSERTADLIIANADLPYVERELEKRPAKEWSGNSRNARPRSGAPRARPT